jgi:hypothetical protein
MHTSATAASTAKGTLAANVKTARVMLGSLRGTVMEVMARNISREHREFFAQR